MPNPFFEQDHYLWNLPEGVKLHQALATGITEPARIDLIYKRCGDRLPSLALNQSPDLIWKQALEQIAHHGLLQTLCGIALDLRMPAVRAASITVMEAVSRTDPIFDVADVLTLDREALRKWLALLGPDSSAVKVLLVRGGPKTGKSHSVHLFERASRDWNADAVYICDGIVGSVDDVFRKLFSVLEATDKIPARGDTTEDAWHRSVCYALYEAAKRMPEDKRRPLWIAVDDLGPAPDGSPLLDQNIRRFCEQLALQLIDPAFRKWFRLLLIHYPDGPLPTKWKRELWREDRTAEVDVTQEHVEALLRTWLGVHDRRLVEEDLKFLAHKVIADAEALLGQDDAPRLQRINDVLNSALQELGETSR